MRISLGFDTTPEETEGQPDESVPVCPGCHAVGEEHCLLGCIDAEIAEERKARYNLDTWDREP